MTHFTSMKTLNKLVASLMVAAMFAAAFFVSSPAAKADGPTTSAPVTGTATIAGVQGINSAEPFSFTGTATGKAQADLISSFDVDVSDTTNGTGWKLTAYMDPMADLAKSSTLAALPKITSASANQVVGSVSNTVGYNSGIQLKDSENPEIIFSSAKDTNVGQSTVITFDTSLNIPAATANGTYVGTLTLTIANGVI